MNDARHPAQCPSVIAPYGDGVDYSTVTDFARFLG